MKRSILPTAFWAVCVFLGGMGVFAEPVFPGAMGFGSETPAGRGGRVIKVTNLEAAGEGSLRAAIEAEGPRIVVFEVGGVIDLERRGLSLRNPHITIAGQTAPDPGITLIRGGLSVSTHDVLVRHIAVRPGDAGQPKKSGWEPDAMSANGARNVVFDHCSATWSVDENLSVSGARLEGETSSNVTLSHCIVAESLDDSSHAKGPHSKGTLIHDRVRNVSIHNCLYAHNADRNPYFKIGSSGVFVNNLIYNPGRVAVNLSWSPPEWAGRTPPEGPFVAVVGNVMRLGADSRAGLSLVSGGIGGVYLKDNIATGREGEPLEQTRGAVEVLAEPPLWPEGLTARPGGEVEAYVLANAGARPARRHAIDRRIIEQTYAGEGRILNSQDEAGGYPADAMTRRALDVPEGEQAIEDWLEAMAREVEGRGGE